MKRDATIKAYSLRFARQSVLLVALAIGLTMSFAAMIDVAVAQDAVHVTKAGSPDPDGSLGRPYRLAEVGIARTLASPSNTVLVAAGTYYEMFTTDTRCVLRATGGTVRIGWLGGQTITTLETITLNTHLFGDVVGPIGRDCERADDIADFVGGPNPLPEIVAFQEIWDEDLFLAVTGANGILPRSGYAYGNHGDLVRYART